MKNAKVAKKLKYGSMAVVSMVIVIAIVIVVNIMMGVVEKRYPKAKLDLTKDKRFELCDESINVLKNLKKDVEIAVMYPEETLLEYSYYNMIPKVMEKYELYSKQSEGSVDVKYYDIQKDPDAVSKYKKYYNGDIAQGSVVVYCDGKVRVSNITNYITIDQDAYYSTGEQNYIFIGESTITSAIMSVADSNPKKAALLDRMGEGFVFSNNSYYNVIQLFSLLSSNGYEMEELDVSDDFLDNDFDVIVIPAPEYDFTEDVIQKLDDYLYNDGLYGRNVVYVSSPTATEIPNLKAFLDKWSIEIGDAFVSDDDSCIAATLSSASQAVMSPKGEIADTDTVGELPNSSLPIAVPYSRPVSIITRQNDVLTSMILQSSASAYKASFADLGTPSEEKGVEGFVVKTQRQRQDTQDQFKVVSSNVVAFGSLMMFDPAVMGNTNAFNNANFILNVFNSITGKDASAVIPQKNLQDAVIKIDQKQVDGVRNVVVYIIPAVVVVCGIIVFIRRKNK